MTWWGMLQRQRSVLQDRQEYTEQTLTIPLPTNTADPEQAILTTFFYMLMNQQRSQAFQSQESPLHITQRLLVDWIQMAGDYHRLASQQTGYPRTHLGLDQRQRAGVPETLDPGTPQHLLECHHTWTPVRRHLKDEPWPF